MAMKRRRMVIKMIGPRVLLLALVAGAALNVAVAWVTTGRTNL